MKRLTLTIAALALFLVPTLFAAKATKVRTVNVKVSGGVYVPETIKAKKGERLRLNFTRDEKPTCGDSVSFPDLKITRKIAEKKTTSIELTANKDMVFTCGMDMMQGKIDVQ
jgi:plastocyanin domain-containing protein